MEGAPATLSPLPPRIVDDAPRVREAPTTILSGAGFACSEAGDVAEAFNMVLAGGVDLRMDGFGLMSAIGLLPAWWAHLP